MQSSNSELPATRKRTILIVDDNEDAADTLAMLVEVRGHVACVAYDAQLGIALAHEIVPDIIFHDIGMPHLSGYGAMERLRDDSKLSHTLFVALSGYESASDRERSRVAGFHLHLSKPMELHVLDELLNISREL